MDPRVWNGFRDELTKLSNGGEVSEEQKEKIREYVRKHKITDDDEFHRFAESIGVEPDDAEPIVYQMAHEGANEGMAAKKGKKPEDFDILQLAKGVKIELEHTNDRRKALQVAMDHLTEFPKYYDALEVMERKLEQEKTAKIREAKKIFGWVRKKKPKPIKVPGEVRRGPRAEAKARMESFLRSQR